MKKHIALAALAAATLAAPMMASAESTVRNGNGDATARLNFRVVVPRVLFLGVGTGAGNIGDATTRVNTVDRLTFNIPSADVGNGVGTAAQVVDVRVKGNSGQIALAANSGSLGPTNATSDVIPWGDFTMSSSDATNLAVPAVGTSINVAPDSAGGKLTERVAQWSFSYNNTAAIPAGRYDGQITYTASAP
ncbi:hypothetical protein [Hydrogenophaga sp. 5NK40-0174]|uniref:hypothetical protein n=1 Tax=Hydrogenophaga sp. 5NK40-0174 TaxID=3127649 RepID=UPI00310986E5